MRNSSSLPTPSIRRRQPVQLEALPSQSPYSTAPEGFWSAARSSTGAQLLASFAVERGMRMQDVLAGSGVDAETLCAPDGETTKWQELSMVRNVTAALGDDPRLGLLLGMRYHVTTYGLFGLALLSSSTIRAAIDTGLRYLDLGFALTRLRFEWDRSEVRLYIDDQHLPHGVRAFLVNRDAAGLATLRRELTGVVPRYSRMTVNHQAPEDTSLYERLWQRCPEFGSSRTMVAYSIGFLDVALAQASERTRALCIEHCDQLVKALTPAKSLVEVISERLLASRGRVVDMETMARQLAMSARTLRRQLASAGTTYRELVDRARLSLAAQLLVRRVPIAEVAERLGYSGNASFHHAFRRLTGITPDCYRQTHGELPDAKPRRYGRTPA